jgi:hypothetical protein
MSRTPGIGCFARDPGPARDAYALRPGIDERRAVGDLIRLTDSYLRVPSTCSALTTSVATCLPWFCTAAGPRCSGSTYLPFKADLRYWTENIFRRSRKVSGRIAEAGDFSVRIQHEGRREFFNLLGN